ncbi:MAG: class I SAM-dependent RNA methyltransferase [Alphaproteobacteria bacterium]|nr:class I SAM-dependent RNA methyltransferase [Alphaproteobacteria bacterium]
MRIERVGAEGDGVGTAPDGTHFYVPSTLPDETVQVRAITPRGEGWMGEAEAILAVSPARIEPPCPHFGTCGGCTLQHWRDAEYVEWKGGLLEAALRRAGYGDVRLRPAGRTPSEARRRMDLALRRDGSRVVVGLHRARGAEVIDLHTCVIAHPALRDLIAPLREVLAQAALLRREGSALLNLLDSGPDLLLRTDAAPSASDRALLAGFARAHGLPRISWARGNDAPEAICVLRPAVVRFADLEVAPPPGAFLQASAAGERAIIDAVLDGLPEPRGGRSRIVELYAGFGTITFALAARGRVSAFEGDAPAIAALRRAANQAGFSGRIVAEQRDLARQPLTVKELAGTSAIVLDPPHAGAAAQMPAIAAAKVARVIYVSCNPAALARDARVLREAGYDLLAATPIDQFLWSPRLEAVVVFGR